MSTNIRIVIIIKNGLVYGIMADHPKLKAAILDRDVDGANECDLIKTHRGEEAFGQLKEIEYAPRMVENYFADIQE